MKQTEQGGVALSESKGFTLIEIVVAITFMAIAFAAVMQIFISTNNLNQQAFNLSTATQLVHQKIEELRNVAYTALPDDSGNGTPDAHECTGSPVTVGSVPSNLHAPNSFTATYRPDGTNPCDPTGGIVNVEVKVTWSDNGVPKQASVQTLIGSRGIGK